MNNFAQIIAALGPPPGGPWDIGDDPPLRVTYNPNPGGVPTLIFALNTGVHITIFRNSWDGVATIQDCTGGQVDVGPYCLHTTAGNERWFRQYEGSTWAWVTDCGTPTERYVKAFNAMMNTMNAYLGITARKQRRGEQPEGPDTAQVNRITIGTITSSNPTLWVNLLTLGQDSTDYTIATASPGSDFMYVNQFCSILSIKWLQAGRGTVPYGIDNFSDADKRVMAQTLIGYTGMDDQIAYAETQLGGVRRPLDVVARGVMDGTYPVGTNIWAGNDFHVIAIYLRSEKEYELYDSNTGLVTVLPRSGFKQAMQQLRNDAFVVA